VDEVIHVRISGALAELLTRVNPMTYKPFIVMEKGKQVIYMKFKKALYVTLQAALLFLKNLT
jgi:hypothetical protein